MTPENIIQFLVVTEGVTVALIGGFFKMQETRREKRDKKIIERNTCIGRARDKENTANNLMMNAQVDLLTHLTIAVQTGKKGKKNTYITTAQRRFQEAVTEASVARETARTELERIYSEDI